MNIYTTVAYGLKVSLVQLILVHLSRRIKCTIVHTKNHSRRSPQPLMLRFDFFSATAEFNLPKLDRKKELNVLYVVWIRANKKKKMSALTAGWLRLFYFSTATAGWNLPKLDRNQVLNVLYPDCVFWSDRNNRIYYHFVQGQGNPPECQRFAVHDEEVAYLGHEGRFPCPCTKWWLIFFTPIPFNSYKKPLFYFRNYYRYK